MLFCARACYDGLNNTLRIWRSSDGAAMYGAPPHEIEMARRAFYATLTLIDPQIRVVIGQLREEGIVENTIIAFTSDHGDMLGDHNRWAKTLMYEMSAKVPLLIVLAKDDGPLKRSTRDDRIVALRDIMPTFLDMASIPIPDQVEGQSLLQTTSRTHLYGEHWEGEKSSRMLRDRRYKLIYYPLGNHCQLFDLQEDPREQRDLNDSKDHQQINEELRRLLIKELYGEDRQWIRDGKLVGLPDREVKHRPNKGLSGQRGIRYI